MWIAPLFILISVGGSYGGDYGCFLRENKCDKDLIPSHPPETPEELLRACRGVQEYASCTADVKETCDLDDHDRNIIASMRHTVSYLSTMCHEDNPTFEVLSSNLDCVMEVAKTIDDPCTFSEETMGLILEHIRPLIENERNEALHCLEHLFGVGCRSLKFTRHCGVHVGEAAESVLMNFKIGPDTCTPEILQELYPLFEGLGDIVREEIASWDEERK